MAMFTRCWRTLTPEETQAVGRLLGQRAMVGDCIVCQGPLGAGKTTFVQGFAEGMGVQAEEYVRSPTFALMHQYEANWPLYHFDFYRLSHIDELDHIGFMDETLEPGVIIIEWGEKFPTALPEQRLDIQFHAFSSESRCLACTIYDTGYLRYFMPLAG